MVITLNSGIIGCLTSKGILAYLAVSLAGDAEASTAALAFSVKTQTGVMLEGLKELAVAAPELVAKAPKNKWRCGVIKAGEGVVLQNLDSERYRLFVDDVKKFWDFLNPTLPFELNGKGGVQIRRFLADHPQWTQNDWRTALQWRKTSIVKYGNASRSAPIWVWISRLDEYAAGALNEYGKPVEGSGKNGQAIAVQDANRQAAESYLSRH